MQATCGQHKVTVAHVFTLIGEWMTAAAFAAPRLYVGSYVHSVRPSKAREKYHHTNDDTLHNYGVTASVYFQRH